MLTVGTDLEALDAARFGAHLLLAAAVGLDAIDLHRLALFVHTQEGDTLAILDPL